MRSSTVSRAVRMSTGTASLRARRRARTSRPLLRGSPRSSTTAAKAPSSIARSAAAPSRTQSATKPCCRSPAWMASPSSASSSTTSTRPRAPSSPKAPV